MNKIESKANYIVSFDLSAEGYLVVSKNRLKKNFLTDLACDGQGVLVRSIWAVKEQLQTGELIQVLTDYPIDVFGYIYAVIPSKRYLAPRVRVFLDYVIKKSQSLFT